MNDEFSGFIPMTINIPGIVAFARTHTREGGIRVLTNTFPGLSEERAGNVYDYTANLVPLETNNQQCDYVATPGARA